MLLKFIRITSLLALLLLGGFPVVCAQRIVSMHIDSIHCTNDSLRITFGSEFEVEYPQPSISHPQLTFLPDGVVCDSSQGTCTYRSPITFSAFDRNTTLSSAHDIDFVRINIEHSWIGDIFIALECPNGQFASIINSVMEPSGCGDPKFDTLVGWDSTGQNIGSRTFLGYPFYFNNSVLCDSQAFGNQPGTGWNYCFSEKTDYQYGAGDGLLYRSGNEVSVSRSDAGGYTNASAIDSTHISSRSHFYHPQQSFDALMGCPLNGTWNIVVQDNWQLDNGYMFDWQLAFDSSLYEPPYLVSVSIVDSNAMVSYSNDSSLAIAPSPIDTTLSYTLRVVFSTGDTIDSLFTVHWMSPYHEAVSDTLCMGDTAHWHNLVFTSDTLHSIRDTTFFGCDSIVELSYTFMPSYQLHDTLPFCANESFVYEGIDYGGPTTIVVPHQTQYGCDSTVTVHLVTIDSAFHLQLQMSLDGLEWSSDTVFHGCQPFTVYFRDTTLFEQWRLWSFGDGDSLRQEVTAFRQPQPFTHTYDSVGSYLLSLSATSIHGCVDSTVFRKYAVNVYATPQADFTWSPQQMVTHDPQAHFANLSEPLDSLTFQWIFPGGDSGVDTSSDVSPYYQWPVGTQDVDVVLNAIWTHVVNDTFSVVCTDSSMHTIVILNDYLQFPNVVTPNGDGINDRWEVVNLLLDNGDENEEGRPSSLYLMNELWIFDRWGTLVYHVSNIRDSEDFWDPKDAPDGTYFFRFSARNQYGLVKRQGTIEVVR